MPHIGLLRVNLTSAKQIVAYQFVWYKTERVTQTTKQYRVALIVQLSDYIAREFVVSFYFIGHKNRARAH